MDHLFEFTIEADEKDLELALLELAQRHNLPVIEQKKDDGSWQIIAVGNMKDFVNFLLLKGESIPKNLRERPVKSLVKECCHGCQVNQA